MPSRSLTSQTRVLDAFGPAIVTTCAPPATGIPGSPITGGGAGPGGRRQRPRAPATVADERGACDDLDSHESPPRSRRRRIHRSGRGGSSARVDDAGVPRRAGDAPDEPDGAARREHRDVPSFSDGVTTAAPHQSLFIRWSASASARCRTSSSTSSNGPRPIRSSPRDRRSHPLRSRGARAVLGLRALGDVAGDPARRRATTSPGPRRVTARRLRATTSSSAGASGSSGTSSSTAPRPWPTRTRSVPRPRRRRTSRAGCWASRTGRSRPPSGTSGRTTSSCS